MITNNLRRMVRTEWRRVPAVSSYVACGCFALLFWGGPAHGKDLMPQKEQETTEVGATQSPSFDDQKAGVPQSLFTWIKLAKGYEVEWDTFGRKGWYTQDPRLKIGRAHV